MFSVDVAVGQSNFEGGEYCVQQPTAATSALPGFGTAHLMGRIGTRESTRIVHAALDSGITHFDTARVYGLGDAEQMLGHALHGRPDVSVYTKVGQGHPHHSRLRARVPRGCSASCSCTGTTPTTSS